MKIFMFWLFAQILFMGVLSAPKCDKSCATCFGPAANQCLTCSDPLQVQIAHECKLNDIERPKFKAELDSNLTLWWHIEESEDVIFALQMRMTHTFCAIGFGSDPGNAMIGADIMSVEVENKSVIVVGDRYSPSPDYPDHDIKQGGTTDVFLLGYKFDALGFFAKFTRRARTKDSLDYQIDPYTNIAEKMIWAYSTSSPGVDYHNGNRGIVEVNLKNGGTESFFDWHIFFRKLHRIVQLVLWCLVIDIAIIFSRYLRFVKNYGLIHGSLMIIAIVGNITVEVPMIYYAYRSGNTARHPSGAWNIHFLNGVVILLLIILQLVLGPVLNSKRSEVKKVQPNLRRFKVIHQVLGWILYVLVKYNVYNALSDAVNSDLRPFAYSSFVGFPIIYLIFEISYGFFGAKLFKFQPRNISSRNFDEERLDQHDEILKLLTEDKSPEEIKKAVPGVIYVQLGKRVYDVTDLDHPGGLYILTAVNGREIDRFFYGAYGLESCPNAQHRHSKAARKLLEKFYIGEISNDTFSPFVTKGSELEMNLTLDVITPERKNFNVDSSLIKRENPEETARKQKLWELVSRTPFGEATSLFYLKSPIYSIAQYNTGVRWFGRHFMLADAETKLPPRPYTVVRSMTEPNILFRTAVINYFDACAVKDASPPTSFEYEKQSIGEHLPFVIKNYGIRGGFSHYIHNIEPSGQIDIQGPFGEGFHLERESTGLYVIVAAGTGILPFFDLFDFLLKLVCYRIVKEKHGKEAAERMNRFGEDYDSTFNNGIRFCLIAAFKNKKEFLGRQFIMKLLRICRENDVGIFEVAIRYSESEDSQSKNDDAPVFVERLSDVVLRKYIKDTPSTVFVCGPPRFNAEIPSIMRSISTKSKIVLV